MKNLTFRFKKVLNNMKPYLLIIFSLTIVCGCTPHIPPYSTSSQQYQFSDSQLKQFVDFCTKQTGGLKYDNKADNSAYWNCIDAVKQSSIPAYQQITQPQNQSSDTFNNAVARQIQYQNIQHNLEKIITPAYVTQPPVYQNRNISPFSYTPQQPIQQPTVTCMPNGVGGFTCR